VEGVNKLPRTYSQLADALHLPKFADLAVDVCTVRFSHPCPIILRIASTMWCHNVDVGAVLPAAYGRQRSL
jgi:hypothetical protein